MHLTLARLWSPKTSSQAVDQVIAYAMVHAGWIAKYGMPTQAEIAVLRSCYGIPVAALAQRVRAGRLTAADEWAIIDRYIHPPLPNGLPAVAYWRVIRVGTIVTKSVGWVIVDRNGSRVSGKEFESCIAAMDALDEARQKQEDRAA